MPEPTGSVLESDRLETFLLEVTDVINTTLDVNTLLLRVAEIVRRVIDYQIFAILLLNERTQELQIRFAIGHPQHVIDTLRVKLGEGVTGQAALRREAVLVTDVADADHYIAGVAGVRSELAVPLIFKNKVIGVIDIEAPQTSYFGEEHKRILTLLASRIAVAIENARLYTRVSSQAKSLKLLNEIARDVSSILNLDELLKRIGEELKRVTDYQMFSVLLLDRTGAKLEPRFSLRYGARVQVKHDIPVGAGLVGYAAQHKEAVMVADVTQDARYINLNPDTRSELVIPLLYQGNLIGVLDIEHTKRGYFREQHVRTLSTLAAQLAIAIENARLYETVARQEKQMERDLELARELQLRVLPACCPKLRAAEVYVRFQPARFIGGDLYDFIRYSRDRLGLFIGDVSGKGAPAALYAALVSGFLRSHTRVEPIAAQMMASLNHSLAERPVSGQYVSMVIALWDDAQRQLRISNSGLPQPIYCRQGVIEMVDARGLPAGLFPQADYDELTYHPQPGDLFVFFSDGLTDASDSRGRMLGRSRLEEIIAQYWQRSPKEVVNAIFDAAAHHAGEAGAFDDQTVVALKIGPPRKSKS
ncbi:MAG: GAF domain-containing protein [Terriglobales bacterium]